MAGCQTGRPTIKSGRQDQSRRPSTVYEYGRHVDLKAGEPHLPDRKTGARVAPLSTSTLRLLQSLPRDDDNPWVIAGKKPGRHLTDLQHPWRRIRALADLKDVRIHDLRRRFASRALALGEGLPMIGKLSGHTQVQTKTCSQSLSRYVIGNQSLFDSGPVSTGAVAIVR